MGLRGGGFPVNGKPGWFSLVSVQKLLTINKLLKVGKCNALSLDKASERERKRDR